MKTLIAIVAIVLAGCAPTTSVVLLDPARQYAPSAGVEILLKAPERPYLEIAKLESSGVIGEPEPALLEDARKRAQEIGADAIIVIQSTSVYQPPVIVYEPWPAYLPWYHDRWRGYRYWYYPPPFAYPEVMALPGGNVHTVRAIAIRYR